MEKINIILLFVACALVLPFMSGCEDSAEGVYHDIVNESEHTGGNSASYAISSFGNPNVAKAVEDPNVQIKGLKINGQSGMSYSWAKGNLSAWGLANDQAEAIAVMGYGDGNHFICAKFDWISTSRRTRDFKNLNTGYNGWNPSAFYAAKKHCFFIMSKDGKKRTNVITD